MYARALDLMPNNWFRLHAGLAVAKEVSPEASEVYVRSAFCIRAEDRVKNFALGPYMLLSRQEGALLSLSPEESAHAKQTSALLTALYPSFTEEMTPIGEVSPILWETAVARYINKIFSRSVVAEAEATFSSRAGRELLLKFPNIVFQLDELAQSTEFISKAEKCVKAACIKDLSQSSSSGGLQAA